MKQKGKGEKKRIFGVINMSLLNIRIQIKPYVFASIGMKTISFQDIFYFFNFKLLMN